MNPRTLEFGVSQVTPGEGVIRAAGRIHRGPLRLGDTFSVLFRYLPNQTPDGYGPFVKTGEQSVSIKVMGIRAYQRSFDELEEGMTAELELAGDDAKALKQGDVLGAGDVGRN
jgi:hypothetical protein